MIRNIGYLFIIIIIKLKYFVAPYQRKLFDTSSLRSLNAVVCHVQLSPGSVNENNEGQSMHHTRVMTEFSVMREMS